MKIRLSRRMILRSWGKIEQELPEISFGAAAISGEGAGYSFGAISEGESVELLHQAYELGFRCFDTAPIYGFGTSEKRIGLAFSEIDDLFIVSKGGVDWHREAEQKGRVNMSNAPEILKRQLSESLERLRRDCIDLHFVHWPDQRVDIRQALEPLVEAREKGLIRYIGLANTNQKDLELAAELTSIDAIQNPYNLFHREVESLFPYLEKHQIAMMAYGSLDKGILTGRVHEKRVFDDCDARKKAAWWKKSNWKSKCQRVKEFCEKHSIEVESLGSHLALSFVLKNKVVSTALCGARNSEQLKNLVNFQSSAPSEFLEDAEEFFRES